MSRLPVTLARIVRACRGVVSAGAPGSDQPVMFRMLHIWEFRDGLISRENVWLDGGSIAAQLLAAQ